MIGLLMRFRRERIPDTATNTAGGVTVVDTKRLLKKRAVRDLVAAFRRRASADIQRSAAQREAPAVSR